MKGVNNYWEPLNSDEMQEGLHRYKVGDLWEEVGLLQFNFLKAQGLKPEHSFLDVGCGSLRGGVHFVPYLNAGNYYGLDINPSLIEGGRLELGKLNCLDKNPHLLVNDRFEFSKFETQVDYALALSVFTHLYLNHIGRCLAEMKKVLKPEGVFFATIFLAPETLHLADIRHGTGGVLSKYDSDPFHYSLEEIQLLADKAGFQVSLVADWQHPRGQQMLSIRHHA